MISKKNFLTLWIFGLLFLATFLFNRVLAGTLSCSVTTAAACTGGTNIVVYRMSGSTNAHAELYNQITPGYDSNVVCCSGITGLANACSGVYDIALKLNKVTNSHSQINSQTGYTNFACLSVPAGGTMTFGNVTDPTTCASAGYDTTLGTIKSDDNSHVGNTTAYTKKICGTGTGNTGLPIGATLTSSVFDTVNSTSIGYNSIMWKGTLGGAGLNEGKVRFQLAAADCSNGATNYPTCNTGSWSFIGGATCGSSDYFDAVTPDTPVELKGATCFSSWNNKRYYKYKVQICSNDCTTSGTNSPTVTDIIVNWSP